MPYLQQIHDEFDQKEYAAISRRYCNLQEPHLEREIKMAEKYALHIDVLAERMPPNLRELLLGGRRGKSRQLKAVRD